MIESSWHEGAVAGCRAELADGLAEGMTDGLAEGMADGLALPFRGSDAVADGTGVAPRLAWFSRDTASRLWASKLPPAEVRSSSHRPVCTPGPAAVQVKASVSSSPGQDSDRASSGPMP